MQPEIQFLSQPNISSVELFQQLSEKVKLGEYDTAHNVLSPLLVTDRSKARKAARDIINKHIVKHERKEPSELDVIALSLAFCISNSSLSGYATLHEPHLNAITEVGKQLVEYVNDKSLQQPINFLMLASPGAGKSHFVNCLAHSLSCHNIKAITFNMASMQDPIELSKPLDEVRNAKVADKFPLLFLDEFDSSQANFPLLLPLLWDGAITIGGRELHVGKMATILAGSSPVIPRTLKSIRKMRSHVLIPEGTSTKLADLLSRINGSVMSVPPYFDQASRLDRRYDKAAIVIQLMKRRFRDEISSVPIALLRLAANLNFRYDVRSIKHLVNLIPKESVAIGLTVDNLKLPFDSPKRLAQSSLAYHLIDDHNGKMGILKVWEEAKESKACIPIVSVLPEPNDEIDKLAIAYLVFRISNTVSK